MGIKESDRHFNEIRKKSYGEIDKKYFDGALGKSQKARTSMSNYIPYPI